MEFVRDADEYHTYCNNLQYMLMGEIEKDGRKFVSILTRQIEDLSAHMHRESQATEGTKHLKYYNQLNYKPVLCDLSVALIKHINEGGNFDEIQRLLSKFEQTTRACIDMLAESDHTFSIGPDGDHTHISAEQWYAMEVRCIHEFQKNAVLFVCTLRKELDQRIHKTLKGH